MYMRTYTKSCRRGVEDSCAMEDAQNTRPIHQNHSSRLNYPMLFTNTTYIVLKMADKEESTSG